MSLLIASLYLLCLAFLFGSAVYVYSRDPFAKVNAAFAVLALSLIAWVGTLFVYTVQTEGSALLWWGRANFAAAPLAAMASFGFIRALIGRPFRSVGWAWGATVLLALVSLLTDSVDKAEVIRSGQHVSLYGWLFPLYVLFIVGVVGVAVRNAFFASHRLSEVTRLQLRLVGAGILITAVVGFLTNAALPYFYDDFRFIHVGTLSTIAFLAIVAYAACFHDLFNLRLIIRRAVIYALLVAFALELYQFSIEALTRLLPLNDPSDRHLAAATIALVINAVTQQPLRWWLERLASKLLAHSSSSESVTPGFLTNSSPTLSEGTLLSETLSTHRRRRLEPCQANNNAE